MIPILLKPKLLSLKNRWKKTEHKNQLVVRDLIIVILAILIMLVIFRMTSWSLAQLSSSSKLSYLPPTLPLNAIFFMLFGMLIISNSLLSLGSIFYSLSTDLVLSSPIGKFKFWAGKSLEVLFGSSWMPAIFLSPFLMAFWLHYNIDIKLLILAIFVLVPYFLIPLFISFPICFALVCLTPIVKGKTIKVIIYVFTAGVLLLVINSVLQAIATDNPNAETYRILKLLNSQYMQWSPSGWTGNAIGELIRNRLSAYKLYALLLWAVTSTLAALSYLLFDLMFFPLFTAVQSNYQNIRKADKSYMRISGIYELIMQKPAGNLAAKELKILTRELTTLAEVSLLCSMALIYVYNLRSFSLLSNIPIEERVPWKNLLYLLSSLITAFLVIALSNRLVFPSISREGRSFWIIQTAPLRIKELLQAKFNFWFPPIFLVGIGFFTLSCHALKAESLSLIIAIYFTWCISNGIVRSAIGFGGIFAFFDWEHPSQLIASFGSFIFMIFSISIVSLSLIPAWVVLTVRPEQLSSLFQGKFFAGCYYALMLLTIFLIPRLAGEWAIEAGKKKLEG